MTGLRAELTYPSQLNKVYIQGGISMPVIWKHKVQGLPYCGNQFLFLNTYH